MEELEHQFLEGEKIYLQLEKSELSSAATEFQGSVKRAVMIFDHVARAVGQENIFSLNEELDDIRTDLLRYILCYS